MDSPRRSRNAASSPASQLSSSSATRRRSSSGASGVVGTVLMGDSFCDDSDQVASRGAGIGAAVLDVIDGALEGVAGGRALELLKQQVLGDGGHAGGGATALAAGELARVGEPVAMGVEGVDELGDARAVARDGGQDRQLPVAGRPRREHVAQLGDRAVGVGPVGLVDDVQVGDLEQPGLDRLDVVAHAGHGDDRDRVGGLHDVDLVLADADGLDDHDVAA